MALNCPGLCYYVACDYSDPDQISNIILDLSLPTFVQSAEDKKAFQRFDVTLQIACFANNAMSKIDTAGDQNQFPEPSSSHTSFVYINVTSLAALG